jgi:hypothetical protein
MTLRLNGSTSGYTEIDAPAVAGSNTLVLPTGNGTSGQVLSTNGSGALSWIGAGKILKVVSSTKTDTFSSTTTGSWLDIADLSVSITPVLSSSKVFVLARLAGAGTAGTTRLQMRIVRDSTAISVGNAAGSRLQVSGNEIFSTGTDDFLGSAVFFLDSPNTTSSTAYKLQIRNGNSSSTIYVNRTLTDADGVVYPRGTSSITVMEVAA